jgi:hypothetical protein
MTLHQNMEAPTQQQPTVAELIRYIPADCLLWMFYADDYLSIVVRGVETFYSICGNGNLLSVDFEDNTSIGFKVSGFRYNAKDRQLLMGFARPRNTE